MSNIKSISISDIHIGHNRVEPETIHTNLEKVLYPHLNDELDLLIIAGDVFDTLLDMNGQGGYHAACIIDELKFLAEKHKFFLRVTRGTFSHDRYQNQFFTRENVPARHDGELVTRVFDTVSVEVIESLGITLLYVPDDLPYEDPISVIRQQLEDAHVGKVDVAVVHSYFRHLLPKGIPHEPHNTYTVEQFKSLVKGVVLNGHIHTSAVYDNVITNGSVERLAHGEEEPKGFFSIQYDTETNKAVHTFIENIYATTFKTFDMRNLTIDEVLPHYKLVVDELIAKCNSTSPRIHVRVITDDSTIRLTLKSYTVEHYEHIHLTFKASKSSDSDEQIITTVTDLPTITVQNLPDLTSAFLKTEKSIDMSATQIKDILNAS